MWAIAISCLSLFFILLRKRKLYCFSAESQAFILDVGKFSTKFWRGWTYPKFKCCCVKQLLQKDHFKRWHRDCMQSSLALFGLKGRKLKWMFIWFAAEGCQWLGVHILFRTKYLTNPVNWFSVLPCFKCNGWILIIYCIYGKTISYVLSWSLHERDGAD